MYGAESGVIAGIFAAPGSILFADESSYIFPDGAILPAKVTAT